jgi:hypothetical protein
MPVPGRFILKVLVALVILAAAGSVLLCLQVFFNLFDPQIRFIESLLIKADNTFSREVLSGLSLGMVILIPALAFFPLLLKGIQKSKYLISLFRGVVAAFIFFISEAAFQFLGGINRTYYLLAIVLVGLVAFILIEIIVGFTRGDDKASFRTDIVAAIVSGLLFSLILKVIAIVGELAT